MSNVRTTPPRRALIVDDHDDTRELYVSCLRNAGWHVDEVTDGVEALAVAASFDPHVIVMDLHLPELDGVEATRRLRRDPRTAHILVVACTAFQRHYSALELSDAGFEALLAKPCTPEDLRLKLEALVAPPGT